MNDKINKKLQDTSSELEELVLERSNLINELKDVENRIDKLSFLMFELKNLLEQDQSSSISHNAQREVESQPEQLEDNDQDHRRS